jgi:methionyl aminopeptidase
MIQIKTPAEIDLMRQAGIVVGNALAALREAAKPGVSTADLDEVARGVIYGAGATPSFLGYHGFPATICTSINAEIVHGIPSKQAVIRDGDIVSIDCGAIVDGWHGDAALTVAVGEVSEAARRLMQVTEESLWRGIAAATLGGHVGDISHAVESFVRSAGDYGIVEDYTGHGIGSAMHQPPNVPNVGRPGKGVRLVEGLALAVEPMIVAGPPWSHLDEDEWTVRTDDGSPAAHYEHTFTLTRRGAWVLTALDGGESRLAELGVPFGGR